MFASTRILLRLRESRRSRRFRPALRSWRTMNGPTEADPQGSRAPSAMASWTLATASFTQSKSTDAGGPARKTGNAY
jgi:hypothetical protein